MQVSTEEQNGENISMQDGELQPKENLEQVEITTVDVDTNNLKPMKM